MDVKTAFLNGHLGEEVYVPQRPGFDNGDPRVICTFNQAMYGQKQSHKAWHKKVDAKMIVLGA